MFTINAYNKITDKLPSKVLEKESEKSAEFVAMQLINKYEFIDLLTPEGYSYFAITKLR